MKNPYEALGISIDASEDDVRQRYLALVRKFPPERDPQRFAEIRAAYEELRDPVVSLATRLFSVTAAETLESLAAAEKARGSGQRLPTELLLSLADD